MRRTALVLAAAVAASLIPFGAAHAGEHSAPDPQGDVLMFTGESEEPQPTTVANGDVRRTRFTHGARAVIVTAKYRALSRTGEFRGDYARIVTAAGWKREILIFAGPGNWGGDVMLMRPDGTPVKCAVSHKLDYVNELIRVRVPRGCLGNPGWVRVGLGSFWWQAPETTYADEALGAGLSTRGIRLSPRIGRG